MGQQYRYFYGLYNLTWKNERAVEIPIGQRLLAGVNPSDTLEVGNVLSWYAPVKHSIVDKYERDGRAVREDVVDFAPGRLYRLIVSISTLEHVGWDEAPRDTTKVMRAIEHLRLLLAPDGRLIFTAPVGYNSGLDAALEGDVLPFERVTFLRRMSRGVDWREATWSEVKGVRYGSPYRNANAIVVGVLGPAVADASGRTA